MNRRGFAMHKTFCTDDITAKSLSNRLVSETYAEYGDDAFEMLQQRKADACLIRCAGTRRDQNMIGG